MIIHKISRLTLTCLVTLAAFAIMGGCMRKHIVSTPPAQRPAKQIEPAPASAPVVVEEKLEVIEETYVVDAPDLGPEPTKVEEGDLDAEPVIIPAQESIKADAEKKVESVTAASPEAKKVSSEDVTIETTAPAKKTEQPAKAVATESVPAIKALYYVQVGAFSDLENANKVLARLIADGYKNSRLVNIENGLYRVQAGTFPDEGSAGNALEKLRADYPKGFVLKTD